VLKGTVRIIVVKILFGWILILYFRLQVIYKSYRQVLTPIPNSIQAQTCIFFVLYTCICVECISI